jgi:hypothetical protein
MVVCGAVCRAHAHQSRLICLEYTERRPLPLPLSLLILSILLPALSHLQNSPSAKMQLPPFSPQTIADLLLELYTLLIRLSYLDPARLLLPPHPIPATALATWSSKMDPVALDLIQRLPYVRGLCPVMLAPGTKSKNVAFHLDQAQDPMELGEGAEEYVEKWCVCLTDGREEARAGWWVLNTRMSEFFYFFIFIF